MDLPVNSTPQQTEIFIDSKGVLCHSRHFGRRSAMPVMREDERRGCLAISRSLLQGLWPRIMSTPATSRIRIYEEAEGGGWVLEGEKVLGCIDPDTDTAREVLIQRLGLDQSLTYKELSEMTPRLART